MPRILRIVNRFNLGGPTYNAANLTRYLPEEYETLLVGGTHQAHQHVDHQSVRAHGVLHSAPSFETDSARRVSYR